MQVFRGHIKDVIQVVWHPFHENLFASGSGDGVLMYWLVGTDMEVGSVEDAHDNIIWSLDWHPMGHILASGSNVFTTKFWTRNRPGDMLKDNQQTDHSFEVAKPSDNVNLEIDTVIARGVNRQTSLEHLDLQNLSSSIEADLDKSEKLISDIPGLSESIKADFEVNLAEEDIEGKEGKLKGTVNRIINKQFASNWSMNKTFPITCLMESEPSFMASPPLLVPIPHSQLPSLYPNRPPSSSTSLTNICPPTMHSEPLPPPFITEDDTNIMRQPIQNDFRQRNPNMVAPRNNIYSLPPRFRPSPFFDDFQVNEIVEQQQFHQNNPHFPPQFMHIRDFPKNRPFLNFNNPRNFNNDFHNPNDFVDHRSPFNGNQYARFPHQFQPHQRSSPPVVYKGDFADGYVIRELRHQGHRHFPGDFPPQSRGGSNRDFNGENDSENPFEPHKFTGTYRTFIPLSQRHFGPSGGTRRPLKRPGVRGRN